jgi:hypothetical protein
MTVPEGRLSIFDEVLRFSRAPVLISRSWSLMTQVALRPFRAGRNLSLGGWTGRIDSSFLLMLVL